MIFPEAVTFGEHILCFHVKRSSPAFRVERTRRVGAVGFPVRELQLPCHVHRRVGRRYGVGVRVVLALGRRAWLVAVLVDGEDGPTGLQAQ